MFGILRMTANEPDGACVVRRALKRRTLLSRIVTRQAWLDGLPPRRDAYFRAWLLDVFAAWDSYAESTKVVLREMPSVGGEYQARLDQTTGDAWKLWTEMQELATALKEIQDRVPELQTASENAERAYMAGDLPALTYVTLQSAVLNRQSEISDLRQSLWNDAIALSSVLGTQIQPAVEMKEPVP